MSRRRGASGPVFPSLPSGVQAGLKRLVSDNQTTVANMLDCDEDSSVEVLCEKCAGVMKQQQLSASSFLARFFDQAMLSAHSTLLGKSANGSPPVLAERIAGEWAKNKPIPQDTKNSSKDPGSSKRKADSSDAEDQGTKKAPKGSKPAQKTEAEEGEEGSTDD